MTSDKQIEANKENAKLGGVKTQEGKEISKYNAVKHNVLTQLLSEEETKQAEFIKSRLISDFSPEGIVEEALVERIAIWYVRLQRAVKAEAEQIKKVENPRVEKVEPLFPDLMSEKVTVIKEGYEPKVTNEHVELLEKTYLRYETAIERQFYRALHELERIQAVRKGEKVPPPLSLNVDVLKDE